ncbi:glycosyltransferase family 2 protein [Bifidobacterium tsurumiense]|uniref:Putative glycosyl transferase n=1 Tax=Bifidobacterium tsurumiense TaxID=356829 RepID=A0A087E910_9BIFI|nr:glycosyltransferase family 2 protein [Bifidobacterium tsurumiense]KFJ04261.1 putative glycosyl transferase [Bifidobacterium tsurumiense]
METAKTLTFVVPAFNMEEYLERCVNSLLSTQRTDDIEVIIVDDGSSDGTAKLADSYANRMPEVVRVIHQPNKGHGGAVNTGVAQARGMYVKVVDADDWVGPESLSRVMDTLRAQIDAETPLDLIITDYVYDKVGKRRKHVVRFNRVMDSDTVLSWDDLKRFGIAQYMIMHTLIFRTQVVRDSGMQLPEHTFYVDFIYSYQPFPWVKTLTYLDTPLYHYFIGRDGQSVQTDVMVRRVDQLRLVNRRMVEATPEPGTVPDGLYRYMIHFLAIQSSVTSVFLILSRKPENYAAKDAMWDEIDKASPAIGRDVRRKMISRLLNLPGSVGRFIIRCGYHIANDVIGFN